MNFKEKFFSFSYKLIFPAKTLTIVDSPSNSIKVIILSSYFKFSGFLSITNLLSMKVCAHFSTFFEQLILNLLTLFKFSGR